VLAEDYELSEFEEDEECGCLVATTVIDGVPTEVHHWLPDDFAPHEPSSECGCQPALRAQGTGRLLYEHWDQDSDDNRWPGH
jgi:hypothetical protein